VKHIQRPMEDQEQPSHPPGMGGTEVVNDERMKERSVQEGRGTGETGGGGKR
jgi:hypothetical protein